MVSTPVSKARAFAIWVLLIALVKIQTSIAAQSTGNHQSLFSRFNFKLRPSSSSTSTTTTNPPPLSSSSSNENIESDNENSRISPFQQQIQQSAAATDEIQQQQQESFVAVSGNETAILEDLVNQFLEKNREAVKRAQPSSSQQQQQQLEADQEETTTDTNPISHVDQGNDIVYNSHIAQQATDNQERNYQQQQQQQPFMQLVALINSSEAQSENNNNNNNNNSLAVNGGEEPQPIYVEATVSNSPATDAAGVGTFHELQDDDRHIQYDIPQELSALDSEQQQQTSKQTTTAQLERRSGLDHQVTTEIATTTTTTTTNTSIIDDATAAVSHKNTSLEKFPADNKKQEQPTTQKGTNNNSTTTKLVDQTSPPPPPNSIPQVVDVEGVAKQLHKYQQATLSQQVNSTLVSGNNNNSLRSVQARSMGQNGEKLINSHHYSPAAAAAAHSRPPPPYATNDHHQYQQRVDPSSSLSVAAVVAKESQQLTNTRHTSQEQMLATNNDGGSHQQQQSIINTVHQISTHLNSDASLKSPPVVADSLSLGPALQNSGNNNIETTDKQLQNRLATSVNQLVDLSPIPATLMSDRTGEQQQQQQQQERFYFSKENSLFNLFEGPSHQTLPKMLPPSRGHGNNDRYSHSSSSHTNGSLSMLLDGNDDSSGLLLLEDEIRMQSPLPAYTPGAALFVNQQQQQQSYNNNNNDNQHVFDTQWMAPKNFSSSKPIREAPLYHREQQIGAATVQRKTLESVSNQLQNSDLYTNVDPGGSNQNQNQNQQTVYKSGDQLIHRTVATGEHNATGDHFAASLINVTAPMVLPLSATEAMESSLGDQEAAKNLLRQVSGFLRSPSQLQQQQQQQKHLASVYELPSVQNVQKQQQQQQSTTERPSARQSQYFLPHVSGSSNNVAEISAVGAAGQSIYSQPANQFSPRPFVSSSGSYSHDDGGGELGGAELFAAAAAAANNSATSASDKERMRLDGNLVTSAATGSNGGHHLNFGRIKHQLHHQQQQQQQQASGFRSPLQMNLPLAWLNSAASGSNQQALPANYLLLGHNSNSGPGTGTGIGTSASASTAGAGDSLSSASSSSSVATASSPMPPPPPQPNNSNTHTTITTNQQAMSTTAQTTRSPMISITTSTLGPTTNGFITTGSMGSSSSSSSSSSGSFGSSTSDIYGGQQQQQNNSIMSTHAPQTTTTTAATTITTITNATGSSLSSAGAGAGTVAAAAAQSMTNGLNRRVFNLTRVEHISAECSNDLIRTVIVFNGTFKGIIYSSGYVRDPSCLYINGTGKTRYDFSIRLNQCGTLGRQEIHPSSGPNEIRRRDQVMWNTLSIQYNPIIEQEWDEHFRVSCEYGSDFWKTVSFSPFNVETNTGSPVVFTVDPPQCQMEILRGHGMVGPRQEAVSGPVTVGDPLTLLIHMKSEKAGYDILVKNCIAHNGGHQKMQLIDSNGCVVNERFISPFRGTYNDNDLKHVTLYSYLKAFRFTGSPVLYLECEIHMCQSSCPPQMCYWRRLSKRSTSSPGLSNTTINEEDNNDQDLDLEANQDFGYLDDGSFVTKTTTAIYNDNDDEDQSSKQSSSRRQGRKFLFGDGQNKTNRTTTTTTNKQPQISDKVSLFQALEVRQEREPDAAPYSIDRFSDGWEHDAMITSNSDKTAAATSRASASSIQMAASSSNFFFSGTSNNNLMCYRRVEILGFLITIISILFVAISVTIGCCWRAASLKSSCKETGRKNKHHQLVAAAASCSSLTSAKLTNSNNNLLSSYQGHKQLEQVATDGCSLSFNFAPTPPQQFRGHENLSTTHSALSNHHHHKLLSSSSSSSRHKIDSSCLHQIANHH